MIFSNSRLVSTIKLSVIVFVVSLRFSCGSVVGNTIERAQDSEKGWNEKSYH